MPCGSSDGGPSVTNRELISGHGVRGRVRFEAGDRKFESEQYKLVGNQVRSINPNAERVEQDHVNKR